MPLLGSWLLGRRMQKMYMVLLCMISWTRRPMGTVVASTVSFLRLCLDIDSVGQSFGHVKAMVNISAAAYVGCTGQSLQRLHQDKSKSSLEPCRLPYKFVAHLLP